MHKLQRDMAFWEPVTLQTAKQMTNLKWAREPPPTRSRVNFIAEITSDDSAGIAKARESE